MPPSPKVLLLAMDAGDKTLLRQWAADGTLPAIRSLLRRGLVGETISLAGFYEGSTWPSFYTGVTPARHGFHSLTQLNPGTYDFQRCYPGDFIKAEPFWDYLSTAGRKVAILDVPLSGISKGLKGMQMVEWASHDGVYGFQTWPATLKWQVLARFGRHPVKSSCDSYRRTRRDFCGFKDHLLKGVQRKAELTIHYLKKGGWDFFAQVFSEGHCVGHQCWHLHDPRHPGYDPETAHHTGDPVRAVYQAIDSALGRIMRHVDKDTIIFFLATHRMAHAFGGNFLLAEILKQLNLAVKRPDTFTAPQSRGWIRKGYEALLQCWRQLPENFKETLGPAVASLYSLMVHRLHGGDHLLLPSEIADIDLYNSKCFPLQNGNAVSGIRINLAGREPNGLINPGDEAEDFCEELAKNLLSIVDGDTGKPLVKSVQKTVNLYRGDCLDHLPDLLVEWNDDRILGSSAVGDFNGSRLRLASEKLGVLEGINTYVRTGDHRPEGLFTALGPGIQSGNLARTVSIMDFAPTFTELLGVKMPEIDGQPITEILAMVR
jgi:predicted AlkP superfamily phosphohydrolase/phosphomutase